MLEKPQNILTPDRYYWYDLMIEKGFAEKNEQYLSLFENDPYPLN